MKPSCFFSVQGQGQQRKTKPRKHSEAVISGVFSKRFKVKSAGPWWLSKWDHMRHITWHRSLMLPHISESYRQEQQWPDDGELIYSNLSRRLRKVRARWKDERFEKMPEVMMIHQSKKTVSWQSGLRSVLFHRGLSWSCSWPCCWLQSYCVSCCWWDIMPGTTQAEE